MGRLLLIIGIVVTLVIAGLIIVKQVNERWSVKMVDPKEGATVASFSQITLESNKLISGFDIKGEKDGESWTVDGAYSQPKGKVVFLATAEVTREGVYTIKISCEKESKTFHFNVKAEGVTIILPDDKTKEAPPADEPKEVKPPDNQTVKPPTDGKVQPATKTPQAGDDLDKANEILKSIPVTP